MFGDMRERQMIHPSTTGTNDWLLDATDSTVTFVQLVDGYYSLVVEVNDLLRQSLFLIDVQRISNAKAARAVLRLGLFLAMNPPKRVITLRGGYWRKILRCNRYGIGLRLRI